ncbi:MAG: MFS transporter [Acidobacteria bacterium]|nr:MFS transporter [Acidobacteriota bacterium]
MGQQTTSGAAASSVAKIKNLRWYICGLLFFATVVNYVDRQVLGALAPQLQKEIGWTESEYSQIVIAFQIAYAVMFLVWGGVLDRIGVKRGFTIALILWSLAAIGHAFVTNGGVLAALEPFRAGFASIGAGYEASWLAQVPLLGKLIGFLVGLFVFVHPIAFGFAVMRFLLGLGEAANFPASIKTVAEWFPKKERALATGIFNAGTNVGAIVAPATALWLSARYGWQSAFIFTGVVGFLWLIFWLFLYQSPEVHQRLSAEEFSLIRDTEPEEVGDKTPWLPLLKYRQLWAFSFGKMLTDPVWWFYLFWLPKFLNKNYGVEKTDLIPYLTAVYIIADVGSVGGGWLSSVLIKRGWTVNRARKLTLFIFAAVMPLVAVAYYSKSAWMASLLIGIAAGAHQGWSANLFTLPGDMFPRKAVASVVGIGSCMGALGGIVLPLYAGKVLDKNPNYYLPMFIIAGGAYLVAWCVIHVLVPKMEPAKID